MVICLLGMEEEEGMMETGEDVYSGGWRCEVGDEKELWQEGVRRLDDMVSFMWILFVML